MKVNIVLLAAVLTFLLKLSSGQGKGSDCMETAFCCLIKGDIARESEKYGKDSAKYYKEAEDYLAKAREFNKTNTESIQKDCEASYKTCSDEVVTMAVDGLNFPAAHRSTCSFAAYSHNIFGCMNLIKWPAEVRKFLPEEHLTCRIECIMDDVDNLVLSNGKKLEQIPRREDYNMTNIPEDLEPRYRPHNGSKYYTVERPIVKWISGFNDTGESGWGRVDTCPLDTFVYKVDNLDDKKGNGSESKTSPLYHVDMVCHKPESRKDDANGHIISDPAREIRVFTTNRSSTTGDGEGGYDFLKTYDDCGKLPNGGTYLIGVSLSQRTYLQGTKGIGYVNTLCGASPNWNLHFGSPVDSDLMICDPGTAVCSMRTKNGNIQSRFGQTSTTVDVRIGCCEVPDAYKNKTTNLAQPPTTTTTPASVTQPPSVVNPVPPTTPSDGGDEGIFKLQRLFLLIWGRVLNERITRYNYYYTPENVDKEREWETTKCADGTFVNGFEVANPVSNYFWTRRIMQLKFQCGAVDGSKANELDLYKRLTQKKFTLREPESENGGKKECKGGHYTSMQIDYYLNKYRTKTALVNAWGFSMKCSKGGNVEPHKHLINSTPRNSITENELQSGVVDCGSGKAICGFSNKITENRKGAFEGLYYKVLCCPV